MSWYFDKGSEDNIIVSTRIRLARNIEGINFLNRMTEKDEEKVINIFKDNKIADLKLYKLSDIDEITKLSLVEKHILSKDILNRKNGAFLLSDDEKICVMLNEEDHIRIQVINSGANFKNLYNEAKVVDENISKLVKYAYSEKYGFLTTCPTNLGTGLRVSVMLHLPALRITGRIQKVLDVINKVNVAVRGVYGEGSSAIGDMYQLSNKVSLGISEEDVLNSIKKIAETIIKKEREAREFLKKSGIEFEDKISRMYGNLSYARKIDYSECAKLISNIKLGVDMGIINDIDIEKVNKIRILAKPASLQKHFKSKLEAEDRDIKRAELIKEILNN